MKINYSKTNSIEEEQRESEGQIQRRSEEFRFRFREREKKIKEGEFCFAPRLTIFNSPFPPSMC